MTTTMTDQGLDFLMADAESESGGDSPAREAPSVTVDRSEEDVKAAAESERKALDSIVETLMPSEEAPPKAETKEPASETTSDTKAETQTLAPPIHNPQLLNLAGSWGIGPDDAARYPTEEALLGAVALREIRFRNAAEQRAKQAEAKAGKDETEELAVPPIELDDDTDPKIKAAITALAEHNRKLQAWADGKIAAQEAEITRLTTEHGQAAEDRRLETEAKNARLFDEKVASWGDEFKQLLGTPTETWRHPGTDQNKELLRLHAKTRQLSAGHAMLTGRDPTSDELGGFIDEARYALWPDRIKAAVRQEISNGAKRQRGGVGMRPGKARDSEPPAQGDDPAKAAIGDYMAEHGLDPWARRKAS